MKIKKYKILAIGDFSTPEIKKRGGDFFEIKKNSRTPIDDVIKNFSPSVYIPLYKNKKGLEGINIKISSIEDFTSENIIENSPVLKNPLKKKSPPPEKLKKEENPLIDEILGMVDTGPSESIGEDESINEILNQILLNQEFNKIRSSYSGIKNLINNSKTGNNGKISIHLASSSSSSIEAVLKEVENFYLEELPNIILIDHGFDNKYPSLNLIKIIEEFAEKMMIPLVISVNPELLHLKGWNEIDRVPYLKNYIEDISFSKLGKLMSSHGGDWVIASCNSFFTDDNIRVSSVWAIGSLIAKAVIDSGWPLGIENYEIKNIYQTDKDFTNQRLNQLIEVGITPLAMKNNKASILKLSSFSGKDINTLLFLSRLILHLLQSSEYKKRAINQGGGIKTQPEQEIKESIENLFFNSGYDKEFNIEIKGDKSFQDGEKLYNISLNPHLPSISEKDGISFSMIW